LEENGFLFSEEPHEVAYQSDYSNRERESEELNIAHGRNILRCYIPIRSEVAFATAIGLQVIIGEHALMAPFIA